MCLNINQTITQSIRNKFKLLRVKGGKDSNPFITCYKVYRKTPAGYLKSIFFDSCIKKPRFVVSDRKSKKKTRGERKNFIINKGIHVFCNRGEADSVAFMQAGVIVVPVRCYGKDFVAAGERDDAVFMKVTIPKATRDRMKKRINNLRLKSSKT